MEPAKCWITGLSTALATLRIASSPNQGPESKRTNTPYYVALGLAALLFPLLTTVAWGFTEAPFFAAQKAFIRSACCLR